MPKQLAFRQLCILLALETCVVSAVRAQSAPAWTYVVPNQAAEQAAYDNVLHWTWTADLKTFHGFASSYGGAVADIHGSTEGDDLWTWYQQYLRTGSAQAKSWAQGYRDFYVNGAYEAALTGTPGTGRDNDYLYDHLYGWGLVLWAHYENDAAALAKAAQLGALAQVQSVVPGSTAMAYYGPRRKARHTILATYLAQEIGGPWITLRDNLLNAWVQSPDWRAGAAGGMYFVSKEEMQDSLVSQGFGGGEYDAGTRVTSAFQVGLVAEALWRGYLATGRDDIKTKLIAMARWVQYYAHDPTWVQPMAGDWFGQNGNLTRRYSISDSGNVNIKSGDPSYDTSMVNTLVIGYKLTGDATLLTAAGSLFRTGTLYPSGAPSESNPNILGPANRVYHYVDTLASSGDDFLLFDYNKGELQYSYLLFENGGNPIVMGTVISPRPPTNLTAQ